MGDMPAADGVGVPTGEAFERVLDAARLGAGWARTRLWETYAGPVIGYLRAQGAREPEDLTSEVFLAVFARLPQFDGTEARFRSFVFTIAHHKLIDERRRRSRRPDPVPLDDLPAEGPATPGAEVEALASLGTSRTRALLDGLTPDQRNVLTLRILADLPIEQVATVLGKPEGAVKSLQRRALDALRRQLAREGVSR